MMEITYLKGFIPVQLPELKEPIVGVIESDRHEGLTITIEKGRGLRDLHNMLSDGHVIGLAFHYIPAEKAD